MGSSSEPRFTEVEWQFDAFYLDGVAAWLRGVAVPGYTVTEDDARDMVDEYFDTEDWRVYRGGYTYRHRRTATKSELTLKAMAEPSENIRRRHEASQQLEEHESVTHGAGGAVRHMAGLLAGTHPFVSLFTVETHRRRWHLSDADGDLGEIALDDTEVPARMHPQRIRRVEIEVDEAAVDRAMPFVERLVADCGLLPATSSKFGAGLDASGLRPPGPLSFGDTSIQPKMTAGELAMAVLRLHFAAFVANEPGTRLGDDIEPLHQMRVATRRIRAALRVFAPYLPGDAKRYRDEFSWVGGGLGPVRDLDVQLERVPRWRAALDVPEASSLGEYEAHLGALREEARCRMFEVLNSPRYDELVAGFAALLQSQPPRTLRITDVAPALIAAEHRRLRKLGDRITPESAPGDYHRLRVAVKHLRYTLEFIEPAYGRPVRRAINDAVALQDLLGLHQDADIAVDTLRSAATAPETTFSPATILALGGVIEQYRGQMQDLRARFPRRYRSLTGDRWRRVVTHVEARA